MLNIDELPLDCLERETENKWTAICPCHTDCYPTLTITFDGEKHNFSCRMGCSMESIMNAISAKTAHTNFIDTLVKTDTGRIKVTVENFENILLHDDYFIDVKLNILNGKAEKVNGRTRKAWTDCDDADARKYIESVYGGIYNKQKYEDAFKSFLPKRSFHPIRELLSNVQWDGKRRCENCLSYLLGADDTPYTKEVSRLLFAGGIKRIYEPGSKFDYVPVLIDGQGTGKSTFCHWLALDDDFYNSAKTISTSNNRGYESICGKWIVELEELYAMLPKFQNNNESEKIKAFFSTQSDTYRTPYDKHPTDVKRQCIFIGTTNQNEFLYDKTGNRRFLPINCHGNAKKLYTNEKDNKEYIKQCWAEMLHFYNIKDDFASTTPNEYLRDAILERQTAAEIEDFRIGVIQDWLNKERKDTVCIRMVIDECLAPYSPPKNDTAYSRDIGEILVNKCGFERCGTIHIRGYGSQKAYRKIGADRAKSNIMSDFDDADLPDF